MAAVAAVMVFNGTSEVQLRRSRDELTERGGPTPLSWLSVLKDQFPQHDGRNR